MQPNKREIAKANTPVRVSLALVALMLATGLSPLVVNAERPEWAIEGQDHGTGATDYMPPLNASSVNTSVSGALVVDANRTFTDGSLVVEPIWTSNASNGSNLGVHSLAQWNGTHVDTNGIGHGGQLTLATDASLGTITDFESTVRTASGWMGTGDDHEAWAIVQPSLQPLVTQSGMILPANGSVPTNQNGASQTVSALSTRGLGDLGANMSGCIRSPAYPTPNFVNNYTLAFRHWLALNSDDAAWVEVKDSSGAWVNAAPINGYNATSTNPSAPAAVWNGIDADWAHATFTLDAYLSSIQESIEVRFCFATGTSSSARGGWFVDELLLQNQGDEPGSWFHGNLSGNYLPNAEGQLTLSLDFSNHTGQSVELELSSNWDIEGGSNDHLTVWISFDNGSTYSPISNHPGHPNNGALCNGVFFNGPDSNNQWCPVLFTLPWTTSSPQNASTVHLRFWVQTNGQINFGGTASSGWEGIAIDDISVWTNRGASNQARTILANFTGQPAQQNGSSDGWLTYDGTAPNEWQWNETIGNNGPTALTEDFEEGFDLPAGWSLEATSNRRWEVGLTSNTSGFGPGAWHSGNNGAGIYLDDEYRNNMLTHLYTPEYTLPINSTSRLTFRSWVCTEASWDGGAVSISTDGGQSWWFLPPTLNGFHDQISTVNSNSPLFGEGIFDGSTVVGGCHNVNRGFDLKTFDLSNLSGQEVRARFTFFSDQLIELDGWYIDDAGIEIDVYETEGEWTSNLLTPHPVFGWGSLDGFVSEPENTTVRFDVLDGNGSILSGYENRTLPVELALNPHQYPSLKIRTHFISEDTLRTPSVERLTVGSVGYYDAYHHRYAPFSGVGLNGLIVDSDGRLAATSSASLLWDFTAVCPFQSMVLQSYGDNLSATHAGLSLDRWTYAELDTPVLRRELIQRSTPQFETPLALTWSPNSASFGFTFEPHCALEPTAPTFTLGDAHTMLYEWPIESASSSFGLLRGFDRLVGSQSGVHHSVNNSITMVQNGTQTADLTWLMPISNPFTPALMTNQVQFLLNMEGEGATGIIEIAQGGPSLTLAPNGSSLHHRISHLATCVPMAQPDSTGLASCSLSVTLSGNFSVSFSDAVIVPSLQRITHTIPQETLNEVMDAFKAQNASASVVLPLHVTTESGSIAANLSATSQPVLVDSISPIAHQRWLPGQTVVYHTQHWRGDPNQPSLDAPDLTAIDFMLSPTQHTSDAVIHLQVVDVDTTPQFRQIGGVAYAHLISESSSISCALNVCNATWSMTSTWAFDDIDDVHVLVAATDTEGLATGPAHTLRQTAFNEIENDLEVVEFTLTDDQQRNLNDWSNLQWPFHLNASQPMLATGAVRFQGVAQSYIGEHEANVRIDAVAVPPINISGGPHEWPGEPVEWSSSWFAEVDVNGEFSIELETPSMMDNVPSSTRILVSPHIERRGPINASAETSLDFTGRFSDVPFLFDRVAPNTISLLALDPGGVAPANNHIWMKGQDVALRLTLEDQEGLANTLLFHTWLESKDDVNFDGIMDQEEYSVQTISFNIGLTEAVVDLPLLSWSDITGGASSGRASVVIEATDLAGNALQGGGAYGDSTDLATILVQERYDTLIETSTLEFDALDGKLLLGHEHHFSFIITDGNGINSLDEIELSLLGRDQSTTCFIEHRPRFTQTLFDESCFETAPVVTVTKLGLAQEWSVSIAFRLAWSLHQSPLLEEAIPSLKVFDEGQDLGVGLSKLTVFSWNTSYALELKPLVFEDLTLPIGSTEGHHFWVHRNDVLHLSVELVHAGTNIAAEYTPNQISIDIVLSDGERSISSSVTVDQSGTGHQSIQLNETIVKHNLGFIDVIVDNDFIQHDERFNFTIDRYSPQLTVPPGTLAIVDSDMLSAQDIIVILSDQEGLGQHPVTMHWTFLRLGQPIEGSEGSAEVPLSAGTGTTNTYSGTVDMRPNGSVALERTDRLSVWFSASDLAGRDVSGFGTSSIPLSPAFRWVAFEPRFDNIVVTPCRPIVGENISIFVRVANEGLVNGSVTVHLVAADGRILESNTSELVPGSWAEHTWSLEPWTTGRLGLSVVLVDVTGNIPLPMGEVQAQPDSRRGGLDSLGFAVLVVILAAGVLAFSVYRRQEKMADYTRKQVDAVLFAQNLPPPRPKDLDHFDEEQ